MLMEKNGVKTLAKFKVTFACMPAFHKPTSQIAKIYAKRRPSFLWKLILVYLWRFAGVFLRIHPLV